MAKKQTARQKARKKVSSMGVLKHKALYKDLAKSKKKKKKKS